MTPPWARLIPAIRRADRYVRRVGVAAARENNKIPGACQFYAQLILRSAGIIPAIQRADRYVRRVGAAAMCEINKIPTARQFTTESILWAAGITARFWAIIQSIRLRPRPDPETVALNKIDDRVIACARTVSKMLGSGLPEIVYENALAHELRKASLTVSQQQAVPVFYDGMIVGDYTADLLVEDTVVVELRAVRSRGTIHKVECMNNLRATRLALYLVVNFGTRHLNIQRVVSSA
jgi:GxxExxY protein